MQCHDFSNEASQIDSHSSSLFNPSLDNQLNESNRDDARNFTVAVRIKPKEDQDNLKIVIHKNGKEMSIQTAKYLRNSYSAGKCKAFKMDAIFQERATNQLIFQRIVEHKLNLLTNNQNVALMAYGATNSGKTYTILGQNKQMHHERRVGLVHLSYKYLMQHLFKGSFKFYFSYLEIYNQNIQDLLCEKQKRHNLNVFQDHTGKINIPELTKIQVSSYHSLIELIDKGNLVRAEASNNVNKVSSRSHAILQLQIYSVQDGQSEVVKRPIDANFMVIDLAGSEKSTPYFQQSQQITLKQGSNINRSLLSLGNCIKSLANGQPHIPYRNSKLTRLLKENLSGSCHNIMIACINHTASQYQQSISTLQYANKACKIELTKHISRGKDRGKFVSIPCQHCKMSIEFGYLCKSLKQHAFQVIDSLNQKKDKKYYLANSEPYVLKEEQVSQGQKQQVESLWSRILKLQKFPQKIDYLNKLLQHIEQSQPKIQIHIQETQDSHKEPTLTQQPRSKLKLKQKKPLQAPDSSNQRPSRSHSQKSSKLKLKEPLKQIPKQNAVSSYIKIEQQPKSLNISSINSRKEDSFIQPSHQHYIHPFLPQLSLDISDYYTNDNRTTLINPKGAREFNGLHFKQRHSEYRAKENNPVLSNNGMQRSVTQRQNGKAQEFGELTTFESKTLRRMKQDILNGNAQLRQEIDSNELMGKQVRNKIKLICRPR